MQRKEEQKQLGKREENDVECNDNWNNIMCVKKSPFAFLNYCSESLWQPTNGLNSAQNYWDFWKYWRNSNQLLYSHDFWVYS